MIDKKLFNKILTMAFISTTGTAMISGILIDNQYNAVAETTNTSKEPAPNSYINSINNAFSVDHVLSNSENYTQEEKDNATFSNIVIKTLDENSEIKNNTFQTVEEAKEFLKDKTDKDFPAKITDPVSYLIDISGHQSIIKLNILENIDSNSTDSFFIKAEKSGEQTFTIDELTNGKYKAEDGWKISKFNDADVFDIETGLPLNSITINLDKNEILNYKLTITNYKCTDYNWNISLEEQEKIIECFRSLDIEPNISFYRDGGTYTHHSDLIKVDSKYPIAVGAVNDALIRELSDFAKKLEYEEGKNTGALKTDENGEIYFDKQSIADEKILEKIDVLIWEKVNNRFIEIKKRYGIQNEEFFQEYFHFSEEPGKVRIENKNGIGLSKQLLFLQSAVLYDTSDNIWIPTYEVEGNIFHKQEEITPTSSETPSSETPTTRETPSSETPSSETPTTSETPSSKTPTTSETPSSETPTTSETPSSKTPTTSETTSSKTPTNSDTPIVKEPTNTTINTTETITTTKNNTPIIQTRVINPNNTPQTKTIVNDPPNETMINDTGVKVDTGGKNVETIFGKIREIFR